MGEQVGIPLNAGVFYANGVKSASPVTVFSGKRHLELF